MKRIAILLLLCLSSIANAETKSDDSSFDEIQGLMIASKMAGMCGAIKQMATFQESTKMPGGDEFLQRFLTTEQARLGMNPQEFLEACQKSISIYTTYYNMSSEKK
ncbi:hypothetical protein ACDA25_003469 [Salmonella enterica subsp. enterica serovar Schwarzengrund]|uniref:Uncharacterized protein n=1 Tax=Salmonella enterica TaxID=28901 RepID=A0A753PQ75_SALER|nr:hypothetical protein [Salmonella enterica]ECS5094829.1 hypothetical protein [Salmonella enterica subsp. enterica serovar Hadar]EFC4489454.1 hypothetical protein [Escherichia coli]EHH2624176.1 hypothetical protein [Salmonella enterica subsp. enterica serovar Newport]MZB06447.1 hypothetical protein [Salmonella enterica subsp. enterica serovar Typhimurium]ECU7547087.1 hypothetical protein [Salmonella enterica subsp. enterica serovar Hadar]